MPRGRKPWRSRVPAWAFPLAVIAVGVAPHLGKLRDNVVAAHEYWYDSVGHLYLSWERFQALTFQHGFFDFRWFAPYPNTGTYNEPALSHGILFGVFNLVFAEPLAFNLAMIAILALNAIALYLLVNDIVRRPWIAAVFATVGALSPFAWVRYAHPPNTVLFFGLLGLFFLRRAAHRPTLSRCIAAPAMFVLQLFSSFYTGMFFVVPLVVYLPHALALAKANGNLKALVVRAGLASLALAPLLALLQLSYAETRHELGKVNTYEYVSSYMPLHAQDLLPHAPLVCQLRVLGIGRPQAECRDEDFPGRLAIAGGLAGLVLAAVLGARRLARSRPRNKGEAIRLALRLGLPPAGLIAALVLGRTLPFHLSLWAALAVPDARPGRSLAIRSRIAVPLAAALLVLDVALNPIVPLFGRELGSIHRVFFALVPGFDGLRSESRIVVLVPVFLAILGACGARWVLALLPGLRAGMAPVVAVAALGLWALVDAQPMWQEYKPLPRSDRVGAALRAAAALPARDVLAVVKGDGAHIARRRHSDANYFLGHIVLHGHRQVTGYSTYNTPASEAIERAASLHDPGARLPWAARVAYLFGATHLLIDWVDRPAPPRAAVESMLRFEGPPRLVAVDDHMALVALGPFADTTHGPSPAVPGPDALVARRPDRAKGSNPSWRLAAAVDGNPATAFTTRTLQREGEWVAMEWSGPVRLAGVGFSPGLAVESLPIGYVVEVQDGVTWRVVAERNEWDVPRSLIDRPGTGLVTVAFAPVETRAARLRLTRSSPWPWSLASLAGLASDTARGKNEKH